MNPDTGHIFDGDEISKVFGVEPSKEMKDLSKLTAEIQRQMSDREKEIYDNIEKLKPFENGEVLEIKGCYFRIISIDTNLAQIRLQGIPEKGASR